MNGQVVFALGVEDFNRFVVVFQYTAVAYLTTHFSIERRFVEYEFKVSLLFLLHTAVAQNAAVGFGEVPAHEFRFAFGQNHPVVGFDGSSIACALLLLLHFGVELVLIDGHAVFVADEFGEVEGEAVGIEQRECLFAINHRFTLLTGLLHHVFEQVDTRRQGAQEAFFFLLHNAANEHLLCLEFGISVAHFMHERRHKFAKEGFALTEEGIGIAHGTAQNAANYVTGLGNREGDGAQVVGNDAHGHIDLFVLTVSKAREQADLLDDGLEHVGVVVRLFALDGAYQAFEAHTRVDDVHAQRFE